MSLPPALRTFQGPGTIHVKLTSLLSAIHILQYQAQVEKAILPHAQYKDADRGERPQVGKEEVARLSVEPQQADSEEREDAEPAALDTTHHEEKDERQQRQPLVRPNLVG